MTIETLIKWYEVGLLDKLELNDQIRLAKALEYTSKKLIEDGENENRKFNDKVDVIIFPILRRLVGMLPFLILTTCFIDDLLIKVLELTESSVYDGIKDLHPDTGIDVEAELINLFIELNYGQ